MRTSHLLGRIAVRTGVALWKHRVAWLLGAVIIAGLGLYELTAAAPSSPIAGGDCADTTMAAVTTIDDATAHAAYACLGPTMRQTSEDTFVTTLHQRKLPKGTYNRVGDHRDADGSQVVFYAVEAEGQTVGYIVYLNPQGQVIKVE